MRRNPRAWRPSLTVDEIDKYAANRLARQRVLDNAGQQFWFILDEAALRTAGTSTPVIYRRWSTKAKLVLAALAHNVPLQESDIDTGSLRGDLLELVGRGIRRFHRMPGDALPGLITETFREPDVFEKLRRRLVQDEILELIRPFLTRAVERGELRTDRCTDRILRLPFDLLRSESLLYGVMVDDAAIVEIVDDIALPLFRLHCGTPASHT